jgi:hypothetical protein
MNGDGTVYEQVGRRNLHRINEKGKPPMNGDLPFRRI